MIIGQNQNHIYGMVGQIRNNSLTVAATTDNVSEGSSHLYFTSARGRNILSATSPVAYSTSTGVISMPVATGSVNGYLSSTDWSTFNGKANSFSGVTQNVTVQTSLTTTAVLHFTNGILTSVS